MDENIAIFGRSFDEEFSPADIEVEFCDSENFFIAHLRTSTAVIKQMTK